MTENVHLYATHYGGGGGDKKSYAIVGKMKRQSISALPLMLFQLIFYDFIVSVMPHELGFIDKSLFSII